MNYHSRRILTPASRKRKEVEALQFPASSKPATPPASVNRTASLASQAATPCKQPEPQRLASNRLLAGYMAHEFLTKGTLFGQRFDPSRAEALPPSPAEVKRNRLSQPGKEAEPIARPRPETYAEVAHLLKSDGVHIPCVVNPTQLGRWIKM